VKGDLWAGMMKEKNDLVDVMENLKNLLE